MAFLEGVCQIRSIDLVDVFLGSEGRSECQTGLRHCLDQRRWLAGQTVISSACSKYSRLPGSKSSAQLQRLL